MKIALDLDGCCFDFASNMRDWLVRFSGHCGEALPEPDRWDMWDAWGMTKEAWHREFDDAVANGFLFTGGDRYLYPGAKPAVEALAAAGHEIHVISHRPQAAHLATRQWLAEVGIPFDSLTFSADKTAVRCDVIIEDNVDNCLAVIDAGGKAILMDRPWNIVWDIGNGPESPSKYRGLIRANNWPHVLHAVASMTPRTYPREAFDVVGCETGPKPWVPMTKQTVDPELERLLEEEAEIDARCAIAARQHDTVPLVDVAEWIEATNLGDAEPSFVSTNPKDVIGKTKPQLHLVPPAALIYMAKVMALGAEKYDPYNWRKNKVSRVTYLSAALRHILQALDGEDADPETGVPHEASAACCMAIVLDALATGNLIDDRPTAGAAARLIAELTVTP